MRTKLITALRTAASALEAGTFEYNWFQPQSCNCGIVACSILGKSIEQMRHALFHLRSTTPKDSTWRAMISRNCPVTGMPEDEIFKALFAAGLTAKDLVELEYLSNPKVWGKIGVKIVSHNPLNWLERKVLRKKPDYHFTKKENAIKYLRAWADMIQEEDKLDTVQTENTNEYTNH